MEVLAVVFGGGNERIVDGQVEEGTSLITPISENLIDIDFRIEQY